ncbi:MAG: hypothetical protein CBC50_03015 [Synechococcus sp. TMED90]|nr:MAG: hypothetical protein CBC50_03015 [Synechococcus sp. TMED90]
MHIKLQERLQSLKLLAGLASFLKSPGSLESVFAVADSVKDGPLGDQMMRHLLKDSQFKSLVKERWRPEPIDLKALQTLPQGSLGRCYADQLIRQDITPDSLIDPSPVDSDKDFIVHRLKETHDITHVLTGFGIDGASELGLQGFNLAQNRSPLAVMLIFGGMLSALQNDEPLSPMLRALAQGFQMGLDAELVIARKLEDGWDRPLAAWQRELNLPITTLVPSHQDPTVRVTQTTQEQ